ncbi:MAG: BsuPI-related putative proteinase inhibitor [Bacillota bacterium]|nr:BsuPI-related putative proteinase inhibitor [Bacillota bacterium]
MLLILRRLRTATRQCTGGGHIESARALCEAAEDGAPWGEATQGKAPQDNAPEDNASQDKPAQGRAQSKAAQPQAIQGEATRGQLIAGVVMVVLMSALFSGCSARAFENLKTKVGVSEVRVDGRTFKVFTLAALNTGEDPVKLKFSSGMQFDFVVTAKDGTEVWRWSSGKAAVMMLTEREIAPGELAVHSVVWDGTDSSGASAPPGEYEVHAEILTKPSLATGKVAFALGNR